MGDNASSQEIKGLTLLKHVMPWANDDSTESSSLFAREGIRLHAECPREDLGTFCGSRARCSS